MITVGAEEAEKFITLGSSREDVQPRSDEPHQVDVFLRLDAFPPSRGKINEYLDGPWSGWATKEKAVKATKILYEKLFSLQKSIKSGIVAKPLEIIWGIGFTGKIRTPV